MIYVLSNGGNRKYMVFVHTSRYDMASTPIGRAKLRYQKNSLITQKYKNGQTWIANDKIENAGEIFSRLGNVTKLKD